MIIGQVGNVDLRFNFVQQVLLVEPVAGGQAEDGVARGLPREDMMKVIVAPAIRAR